MAFPRISSCTALRTLALCYVTAGASGLLPVGYATKPAREKLDILWKQIEESPYTPVPIPTRNPAPAELPPLFNTSYQTQTFTTPSDEMPPGHRRLLHSYGMTVKIQLDVFPTSPYTGVFQTGGIGLARLSLSIYELDNFLPSLGLKILLDGQASVNIVAFTDMDGQGSDNNFFAQPLSNIIPLPHNVRAKGLSAIFAAALKRLPGDEMDRPEFFGNIPAYEAAAVVPNGSRYKASIKAPYQLTFVPNPEIAWSANTTRDFRENLANIPENTVLYEIYATDSPNATWVNLIGQLVTKSPFFGSHYGDEVLFFQHPSQRWRPPT